MAENEAEQLTTRTRWLSMVIVALVKTLCATVRLEIDREDEMDTLIAAQHGAIFVTWHGRTLLPIWKLRGRGWCALVSLSRDGTLQAENFRRLGFEVIRGSTGRGGARATRNVIHKLMAGGVLAFTPDGPRGPQHFVHPGVVYFAQRSGRPIVPAGISAWPRWLLRSWDRFLIPYPFARACWIYGDPIYVAPDADIEAVCGQVQEAINALEARAEARVRR
jgi:lysophospholipid acyltransferase (LPLAT)-like uncharacterized protein